MKLYLFTEKTINDSRLNVIVMANNMFEAITIINDLEHLNVVSGFTIKEMPFESPIEIWESNEP